jgi:SAM-dependent methyltransferase
MTAIEYPWYFARFYDLIYHQLRDGVDDGYFLEEAAKSKGRILEIGTGTGRFFTRVLESGRDIYGIDVSEHMLKVLKGKIAEADQSRITRQSITGFSFDFKFDLIIAPFRVLMHLTEKKDQLAALNNVFRHLNEGGKFIFDAFIPDLAMLIKGLDNVTDFEGEYEPGKKVRRIVTTRPDLVNQLINISFTIEWEEGNAMHSEKWDFPLRFFFRYEIEHLAERSLFSSYKIYGDYFRRELCETSKEFIVECYK